MIGEKTVYDLKHLRLVANAVPSQLPTCREYFPGSKVVSRMSKEEKRPQRENSKVLAAINSSRMEYEKLQEENLFQTLDEMKEKLKLDKPRTIVNEDKSLIIFTLLNIFLHYIFYINYSYITLLSVVCVDVWVVLLCFVQSTREIWCTCILVPMSMLAG